VVHRSTNNTMVNNKGTKRQMVVDKTLCRILKNGQHTSHYKTCMTSGALQG